VSASGDDVDAGNSCTAFPPLANPQSLAPRDLRRGPHGDAHTARLPAQGKVVLTVKHGKKTVAKKTAKLSSSCKWKAVVKFANRKKLGKKRSGKLVAKARYGGNAALNAKSSKALTVRYG
jgi:hypothetical protein